MILDLEDFSALSPCLIFLRWFIEPIRIVLVMMVGNHRDLSCNEGIKCYLWLFRWFKTHRCIETKMQRLCRHILVIFSVSRNFPQAVCGILCLGIIFCRHQPSQLTIAAGAVVFGSNWLKQKFGFIKRVDKGWIATVKGLESWCVER